MRGIRSVWTVVVVMSGAMACDDGTGEPRGDGGAFDAAVPDAGLGQDAAPIPIPDGGGGAIGDFEQDFCAPLAAYVCAEAEACGCGALVPSGELDAAGCRERWTLKCMQEFSQQVLAVQAGAAHVIRERARACVAMVDELTPACEHARGTIPFALCAPFVVSDEALNGPCNFPWCADGAGVCVQGTCLARGKLGEECGSEIACDTGLACLDGKCSELLTAGQACGDDVQCSPELRCVDNKCAALLPAESGCAQQSACARGLVCSGAPAGMCSERSSMGCDENIGCGNLEQCFVPRACSPRLAESAPCKSDRECAATLYCDSTSGTCLVRPGQDAACGNGSTCAEGLGCDPSGAENPKCLALPGDGQPCALGAQGPLLCAEGLGCTDGVCGVLPGEGAPCTSDSRCAAGFACDFTAKGSVCVKPKALGDACQNDQVCPASAHCGASGTCEADAADGSPCSQGNECSGLCGGDESGGFSCGPVPGQGDPCLFEDDCPDTLACLQVASKSAGLPEVCRDL